MRKVVTYDHWPYNPPPILSHWEWLHDRGLIVLYRYPQSLVGIGDDDTESLLTLNPKLWKGYAPHPELDDDDFLAFTGITPINPAVLLSLLPKPIAISTPCAYSLHS